MPEITLPPQVELALKQQLDAIEEIKATQQRDLKIIFAMAGQEMPKDGRFKLEKGKLTWDDTEQQ